MQQAIETRYNVRCGCGASTQVSLVQAGADIQCSDCERPIQIPSRSALQDLPATVRCTYCGAVLDDESCPKCSAWWRGSFDAGRLGNAFTLLAVSILWLVAVPVVGYFLTGGVSAPLLLTTLLGHVLLFVAGSISWATTKGYGVFVGIVIGVLGPIALLILAFIPNRNR